MEGRRIDINVKQFLTSNIYLKHSFTYIIKLKIKLFQNHLFLSVMFGLWELFDYSNDYND